MKITLIFLLGAVLGLHLPAGEIEPHIKTTEKTIVKNGGKQVVTQKLLFFEDGTSGDNSIDYGCIADLESGRQTTSNFGLRFGRFGNGGWCIWNFFRLMVRDNGRLVNEIRKAPAELVSLTRFKEGVVIDFVWPFSKNGQEGKLCLRFIQYKAMKNWLFLKVKLEGVPLEKGDHIAFSAWPGGTEWEAPGRERCFAISGQEQALTGKDSELVPQGNAIALFNKVWREDYGNLMVFQPEKFETLTVASGGNEVSLKFLPKGEIREFEFALSYFSKKHYSDVVPRFLSEQSLGIADKLARIDWNPKPDIEEFEKTLALTRMLLEKQAQHAPKLKDFRGELNEILKSFEVAKAQNDIIGYDQALAKLKALKDEFCKVALNEMK